MRKIRYAVVAVQRNPLVRFGEVIGYQTEYASVIESRPNGSLLPEGGREEIFGGTIGEIAFRELDSLEESEKVATLYNKMLSLGLRPNLHKIVKSITVLK